MMVMMMAKLTAQRMVVAELSYPLDVATEIKLF